MPIRIRIRTRINMEIRIRIGIKTMQIHNTGSVDPIPEIKSLQIILALWYRTLPVEI